MTRFALKALLLAPLALFFVGTNYFVDPAGLFHRDQERQVAAYLLEGRNVTNVRNHDDRRGLEYFVEGLPEARDVLVFGSSRTMTIDASFFPGETFFNASVPAANLQDLLANYQLFHERGFAPKRVLIGVEPHMLNAGYDNQRYLAEAYIRALVRLGLPATDPRPFLARWIDPRFSQLFSPSYFQVAVGYLPALLTRGRPVPEPTMAADGDQSVVRADGSLRYDLKRRTRSPEDVRAKAARFVAKHPEELAHFHRLDPAAQERFEAFVRSLVDDGVEVLFLFAPYHPVTYDTLAANPSYAMVEEAQRYYRALADRLGITTYGSYDPAACGVPAAAFYDAVHSAPESLRTLFEAGVRAQETAS